MAHARDRIPAVAACALLAMLVLTACAPEPGGAARGSSSAQASTSATATATPRATPGLSPSSGGTASPGAGATPGASPTPGVYAIPTDCRAMVNSSIIAQFGTTPLNHPAFAPVGVQPDGSLVCVWGDPGADTTRLQTTVSRMSRGPALDMLNQLAGTQGFTCFTPKGGTRCEKTWKDTRYPVTDGRTLFWRDGILIDTAYSNLAPTGYTDSIVTTIFG